MKFVRCPICSFTKVKFFGKRSLYRYFQCGRCHHLFLDPMPSSRVLNTLYADNYEFRVDDLSLSRFKTVAHKLIDRLWWMNPSGRTLMDIGAGFGTFVKVATLRGLNAVGIEPAENLYRASNSKRIMHSDLKKFVSTNKKKFDFISAIHVLEHIKEPVNFLKTSLKLLNDRGVLYIETPNSDSHLTSFEKENYTFLTPPDHLNLFSKSSLELLINNIDSNLSIEFSTYSYPEHFVGVLKALKKKSVDYHLSKDGNRRKSKQLERMLKQRLPFFDRVVAPLLTPLLNIGNRGSFLQVFIQKKN